MLAMDKAAFVILHYGEANTTDLCLSSIRQIEGWEKTEVIVVDNNVKKTEPEREIQKKHFETAPNIHVLQNHGQGGFSEANNLVDRKSISYTNWWFKIFHLVLPMVDDRCLIDFIEIFVDTIN